MNCYILTGGRSKRMGRSKAEMFLETVAAAAKPVFEQVVAVERRGEPARPIPTIYEPEHEQEGAIFGLQRALDHAGDRCFVIAVDYARVTSPVLLDLRGHVERSHAAVVVPIWHGIPQTLCAGYAPAVGPLIRTRIAEGKLDLLGLAADARAEMFTFDAPELVNINTPGDLEEGRQ